VVQYDDVINRQRETIYTERERILRSTDLSSTLLAMLEDEVRAIVAENTAEEYAGDWNRDGLKSRLAALIPILQPPELAGLDDETDAASLAERAVDLMHAAYERKRGEIGEDGMRILERLVLLRVIDSLWVEHLTAVDDMRRGIGLRAYSQRDPLNEFKVEAYRMFDELKATIRHDVTHTIFRVSVVREPSTAQPRRMTEGRAEVAGAAVAAGVASGAAPSGGNGARGVAAPTQPVRVGQKIGRNDPCWCGSGRKFKRCHGA
jgi:preprotein translocase subunit SecA